MCLWPVFCVYSACGKWTIRQTTWQHLSAAGQPCLPESLASSQTWSGLSRPGSGVSLSRLAWHNSCQLPTINFSDWANQVVWFFLLILMGDSRHNFAGDDSGAHGIFICRCGGRNGDNECQAISRPCILRNLRGKSLKSDMEIREGNVFCHSHRGPPSSVARHLHYLCSVLAFSVWFINAVGFYFPGPLSFICSLVSLSGPGRFSIENSTGGSPSKPDSIPFNGLNP